MMSVKKDQLGSQVSQIKFYIGGHSVQDTDRKALPGITKKDLKSHFKYPQKHQVQGCF